MSFRPEVLLMNYLEKKSQIILNEDQIQGFCANMYEQLEIEDTSIANLFKQIRGYDSIILRFVMKILTLDLMNACADFKSAIDNVDSGNHMNMEELYFLKLAAIIKE